MNQFDSEDILNSIDGVQRARNNAPFEQVWRAMQQESAGTRIITLWIYRAAVVLVLFAGANMLSYKLKQHRHNDNAKAIEKFADEYGFTQND